MKCIKFLTLIPFIFFITNCKKNNDANPLNSIEDLLEDIGDFDDPPEYEQVDTLNVIEKEIGDEFWICSEYEVDAAIAPQDFYTYGHNSEIIVPGKLLKGNSLHKATPEDVPIRRGPGVINITTLNGSPVRKEFDEASTSKIYEAVNELIQQNNGIVPSNWHLQILQVHSQEEINLTLKSHASLLKLFKVDNSLTFNSDELYNSFMVIFDQSYFNVIFERPPTLMEFFHSDTKAEEIGKHTGPGNPLAYISSVNIGRKFALLIESTEDKNTIEGALNASFVDIGGGGYNVEYVKELNDLRVKAFALGGESSSTMQAVTTDLDELEKFLAEGGDIRSGMPLSYTVRSVLTDKIVKKWFGH